MAKFDLATFTPVHPCVRTMTSENTYNELQRLTLRIPRGLLADLEETVIQQDRQFLSEVARSLGLSVPEVLRRCLGTGAPVPVPVLWAPPATANSEPVACPWWECHGEGLWRPCPRLRLSPTMPCAVHERSVPCPLTKLASDPELKAMPTFDPVLHEGALYWVDPTGVHPPFREDGTIETAGRIKRTHAGTYVWIAHTAAS